MAESAVQNPNLFKSLVALGSKATRQLPEVHGWCTGRGDAERSDSCLVFAGSLDALDATLQYRTGYRNAVLNWQIGDLGVVCYAMELIPINARTSP